MEKELESIVQEELAPLKISRYALDKANYISKRVCELADKPIEVMFYLLGRKNCDEFIVEEVYIGRDQQVRHLHCYPTPAGKKESRAEIDKAGYRIIGHGHSHADVNVCYSPEDHDTMQLLTMQLGKRKNLTRQSELKNKISYDAVNRQMVIETDSGRHVIEADIFQYIPKRVNPGEIRTKDKELNVKLFYGMTFNAENSPPFCCVGVKQNGEYSFHNIDFEIMPSAQKIDEEQIDCELQQRVNVLSTQYRNTQKTEESRETSKKYDLQSIHDDYFQAKNMYMDSLTILSSLPGYARRNEDYEAVTALEENITSMHSFLEKYEGIENAENFVTKTRNNLAILYDHASQDAKLYEKRKKRIEKKLKRRGDILDTKTLRLYKIKDAYDVVLNSEVEQT